MTSPNQAVTDENGKRYYPRNNKRYTSATTVLGDTLPKPALMYWAAREVAITAVMMMAGKIDIPTTDDDALVKWLKAEPLRQRDSAGTQGTIVHEHAEEIMKSCLRAEELEKYVAGIPDYKIRNRVSQVAKWLEDFDVEPMFVESTVYNDKLMYAGSCDLMARVDGVPTIIDFKTSKSVYPSVALQLAAYRYADVIVDDDGVETRVPIFKAAAVLHIKARGYTFREVDAGLQSFRIFQMLLKLKRDWIDQESGFLMGEYIPLKEDR